MPTLADAAEALSTQDVDGLERVVAALAAHGHELRAAEAATVAARVCQRRGLTGTALVWRERAAALANSCPGARTPQLGPYDLSPVLTPREREVALLATTLSSQQIAAKLALSVRTVNNHLGRAYAKLGISSRRQLAALLDPRQANWR